MSCNDGNTGVEPMTPAAAPPGPTTTTLTIRAKEKYTLATLKGSEGAAEVAKVWRSPPGAYMYRVDTRHQQATHGGFVFPPQNTPYFTGAGGLHFWVDIDDAVAYARENNMDHFWACSRVHAVNVIPWTRELMTQQAVLTVPTLVLQVDGYDAPRRRRDELVIPGVPGDVYSPPVIRINV